MDFYNVQERSYKPASTKGKVSEVWLTVKSGLTWREANQYIREQRQAQRGFRGERRDWRRVREAVQEVQDATAG